MKKFTVPCNFNGQVAPFTIYIGAPKDENHPLHFQADWLSKERGGTIPQEVMDSLTKLKDLADKNNVSFEDLCVYALGAAQQEQEDNPSASGQEEFDSEEKTYDDEEDELADGEDLDDDSDEEDEFSEEDLEDLESDFDDEELLDEEDENQEESDSSSDSQNSSSGGIKVATAKIPADQAKPGS
jgi:hypothetical protein